MIRSVFVYGGILVASLAIAWMRHTADPSVDLSDKIPLLQGDAEDITQITWRDDDEVTIVEKKTDAHGEYLWVSYTRTVEVTPTPDLPDPPSETDAADGETADGETADGETADGDAASTSTDGDPPEEASAEEASAEEAGADEAGADETPPAAAPETREEQQIFKAGEKADELLENFSPLVALRSLGTVDAERMESIGLAEPQGELTVQRKGRTATFEVGGEAFGTRDLYLRDTSDGTIYLVDDEQLRPLRYARTQLPDRTLFSMERTALVRAELADASGATVSLVQNNPEDSEQAAWVRADAPDEEASQLETWMSKALQVKSTSSALPDEEPDNLTLAFRLTVVTKDGVEETLSVFEADGEWWARSEHTRALVKILRGVTGDLSADVPSILSGRSEEGANSRDDATEGAENTSDNSEE